jgi:hypothetical protein
MTLIDRIDALSSRFLSDRSYELIVGPAIADLQHDAGDGPPPRSIRASLSVLIAFTGALYDEITADSGILRIGALALIPAMYYAFMIVLILPEAGAFVTARSGLLALAIGIAVMSFAPVLVCCWPERTPRRPDAADA